MNNKQRQTFLNIQVVSPLLIEGLLVLCGLLMLHTAAFAQTGAPAVADNAFDQYVMHPKIPFLDEQGQHVLLSGKAYSPKTTCEGSGCHDYEKIGHSYHIEFGRDESDDAYGKKVGVPHLTSPGWFGGYSCMSVNTPQMLSKKTNTKTNDFLDWGAADFIKACAGCHMGGGFAEKDRDGIRYDQKADAAIKPLDGDYYSVSGRGIAGNTSTGATGTPNLGGFDTIVKPWDWKKSGVMEIDCISCHFGLNELKKFPASGLGNGDGKWLDGDVVTANSDKSPPPQLLWPSLRDTGNASMIRNGFFREAATTYLEFINLNLDDPNGLQMLTFEKKNIKVNANTGAVIFELALGQDGKPIIHWNPKAFDADGKVSLPLKRFTPNENCMNCHSTGNERRGFYGFGHKSTLTKDPNGLILADYRDDVHKGKIWQSPNGVTRKIDNCNACHAKNYYNPGYSTPELDIDHNFLKGNSDMDVRNDLDFKPNARSCLYCHDKSEHNPDPVLPSGHATVLKAHEELWKLSGDMAGYAGESISKITKTHLDVLACETCHITGLKNDKGNSINLLYQYKKQEDGVTKITVFNPYQGVRSTWRDRKGGRVLSAMELKMIYEDGPKDAATGRNQTLVINPLDGKELGRLEQDEFGSNVPPKTYAQFMAVKAAYDKLMEKRGFPGADMQLVWAEANSYQLSHGTSPSNEAMACADCHQRKQSGAFSALIAPTSVLGDQGPKNLIDFALLKGIVKDAEGHSVQGPPDMNWSIPEQRLLDEGHIRFDAPYLKRDPATGHITARTGDVLYATKIDPFLTLAKNSSATHVFGDLRASTVKTVLGDIKLADDAFRKDLEANAGQLPVYYFNTSHGVSDLSEAAVMVGGGKMADLLFPQYKLTLDVYADLPQNLVTTLESKVAGSKLKSSAYWFNAKDRQGNPVTQFTSSIYVKMPYKGRATSPSGIKVLYSIDSNVINPLDTNAVIDVKPDTDRQAGYIIFATRQFGWFVILDVK